MRTAKLWAGLAVPLALLFGPCLAGNDWLVFRDLSHYYQPLYAWLNRAGWPLWNPQDQFGVPLAADPTTGWFYPGRLLFQLGLPVDLAWSWSIFLHLLIAGSGAARLCRVQGIDSFAAELFAGLAYSLNGAVLFCYCNPPYLIGAAWLPWAMAGLVELLRTPHGWHRKLPNAGLPAAMMVLGGDPQSAVNLAIVGSVLWLVSALTNRTSVTGFFQRLARLAIGASLAAALAAGQILATASWLPSSDRSAKVPASMATVGTDASAPLATALAPDAVRNTIQRDRYAFSVGPWHWPGVIVPRWSGSPFRNHQRWTRWFDPTERLWTPTIYGGATIAVILLGGAIAGGWSRSVAGWLCLAGIALLCAAGMYGLNYWLGTGNDLSASAAWGGPYGWLVQFVPGYQLFRYPAKWLPWFALGWSQAAALTWARISTDVDRSSRNRSLRFLASLCLVAALLTFGWSRLAPGWFASLDLPADMVWGPFESNATARQILYGMVWSTLVASIATGGFIRWSSLSWVIALVAIDLVVGASGMIARVPRALLLKDPHTALLLRKDRLPDMPPLRRMRCEPGMTWPMAWREVGSAERLFEMQRHEAQAMEGRWHLVTNDARIDGLAGLGSRAALNAKSLIRRSIECPSAVDVESLSAAEFPANRYFALRVLDRLDPTTGENQVLRVTPTAPVVLWIGQGNAQGRFKEESQPAAEQAESVAEVVLWTPERWVIRCQNRTAGRLLVCQQQDGWWTARFARDMDFGDGSRKWFAAKLTAEGSVAQSITLPPGPLLVELRYRPWHVAWGMFISWWALAACIGLWFGRPWRAVAAGALQQAATPSNAGGSDRD